MGCSIEERWKPLVKYLYYLGISRDGMKRMLLIKPMVFCVDLEETIVPKVLDVLMLVIYLSISFFVYLFLFLSRWFLSIF